MFQSEKPNIKSMETSGQGIIETGNDGQTANIQASGRANLTLDEIIALNKKDANENLYDEAKNDNNERDEFADYLKFSIEIVRAIEKAEENKGWDRRPVKIYLPEGKAINMLIAGETTDRDIAKTLDETFGENCLMVGVKDHKNKTRESATEWKIKDLEEAKKTLGIIFR